MKILVINCGSSSVKYQLLEMPAGAVLAKGVVDRIGAAESSHIIDCEDTELVRAVHALDHATAVQLILAGLSDAPGRPLPQLTELETVGHRVVHGGEQFSNATLIDDAVLAAIERAADLAPLHNPPNLAGIRAARRALPSTPQVACFDTAFHATLPPHAFHYALPLEFYERHGIRRYGFHGTSHRYVMQRAADALGLPLQRFAAITCHLGNGCSMAAIRDGVCIDTSMGFTPLEGLVMGTRSGDIDPAIVFFLSAQGYRLEEIHRCLNTQSGLLGLSGISNDVRTLERHAAQGDPRARLALDVFAYRVKKNIGAYLAVLGRIDALVFTGGIGEHSVGIRAASCAGLEPLGIALDADRNRRPGADVAEIQSAEATCKILITPTNEEFAIARETSQLVGG